MRRGFSLFRVRERDVGKKKAPLGRRDSLGVMGGNE
jgi:hypothetical protein